MKKFKKENKRTFKSTLPCSVYKQRVCTPGNDTRRNPMLYTFHFFPLYFAFILTPGFMTFWVGALDKKKV